MTLACYCECKEKQEKGSPIYLHDMTFYVRRWGTVESQKVVKKLHRELFPLDHRTQPGDDDLVIACWLVEHGVTGWENVKRPDDSVVEFNRENAHKIFMDESYWLSLNRQLFQDACNFENYLWDSAEEDLDAIKKP